eukprot:gene1341-15741_t
MEPPRSNQAGAQGPLFGKEVKQVKRERRRMAERDLSPLSLQIVRGLNDKLYEKRKTAALEIERMVREFSSNNDVKQTRKLVQILTQEFANSQNPHSRKGGLIGLAATAIALGKDASIYLSLLVPPVLSCFFDQDSRVRYYACEALYNIAKVARETILPFFNDIFDGLSKLAADPDPNVKNGAELLDRLIKDVVTESGDFDLVSFMPLLRERIYTTNPHAKQFLVSWLSALDAVPELDLLAHLPEFLDGLFSIFRDNNGEIRKMCEFILGEFLKDIKKNHSNVNFANMVNILVLHSQSEDEVIQFTAITWIREFVALSGRTMLAFSANILTAVLPCVSYDQSKQHIREVAKAVNQGLMRLITTEDDNEVAKKDNPGKSSVQLELGPFVEVLTKQLSNKAIQTRVAVLRWVLQLHMKVPNKLFKHIEMLFPALLKTLSDPSDEVVLLDLEVLSDISASTAGAPRHHSLAAYESSDGHETQHEKLLNTYFTKFMMNLMNMFSTDRKLLDDRGSFIIRHLCLLLNATDIYCALSEILQQEEDLQFASLMVNNLNMILLTSSELFELRQKLKDLANEVYLRLQLLDTERNYYLLKALYGLLMLLPQSSAFALLRNRLDCVPNVHILPAVKQSGFHIGKEEHELRKPVKKIDFKELLEHFQNIQHKHAVSKKTRSAHREKLFRNGVL